MGEMNIKLDDDRLIGRLGDLARTHDRSVESEIIEILESAVRKREGFDRLVEAKRIAAMTPVDRVQADSTDLVRGDRDR